MHRYLVILLLYLLSACGQSYVDGNIISFTRMVDFDEIAGIDPDHYRDHDIHFEGASTSSELIGLTNLVSIQLKKSLATQSLDKSILFAVFAGEKQGGGYAVSIQKIILQNTDLYVYARFDTPQQGKLYEGGTHSPVSVVSVERTALPANTPLTVHLMNDTSKQQVLQQSYTIK